MRLSRGSYLLIPVVCFGCVSACFGQKNWRSEPEAHNNYRFGIGLQALEPTGVNIQMFTGFFSSNGNTYATRGLLEFGAGAENVVFGSNKTYKDGTWKKGGFRVDLNYLYPVVTVEYGFMYQVYVGGGFQTGSRFYVNGLGEQSDFATGGNLLLRLEAGGHGIAAGNDVLFVSIYAEAKYQKQFSSDFNYLRPSIGIRIRKANK